MATALLVSFSVGVLAIPLSSFEPTPTPTPTSTPTPTRTPTPVPGPAAPTNLVATAVSSNRINLTWKDNASNETGFKMERSPDGVNFSEVATLEANVTSYANTNLAADTTYSYRVRAYDGPNHSAYTKVASDCWCPIG